MGLVITALSSGCYSFWRRMRGWAAAVVVCGVAVGGFCDARIALDGESKIHPIPEAPQSHVLDQANMFTGHPGMLKRVQASLARMEQKNDYPIYLVIYYNIYDASLQEVADALYQSWIGESVRGMVIVYQLDPVISGTNPATAYHLGSGLNPHQLGSSTPGPVPGREVAMMLKRIMDSNGAKPAEHAPYISALIHGLEAEMERYHQIEPMRWNDPQNLKLMAFFLGIITTFGLVGLVMCRLLSPLDDKARRVYYFPEVKPGRRLGAPYGGGKISERTFVPASSRR